MSASLSVALKGQLCVCVSVCHSFVSQSGERTFRMCMCVCVCLSVYVCEGYSPRGPTLSFSVSLCFVLERLQLYHPLSILQIGGAKNSRGINQMGWHVAALPLGAVKRARERPARPPDEQPDSQSPPPHPPASLHLSGTRLPSPPLTEEYSEKREEEKHDTLSLTGTGLFGRKCVKVPLNLL